MSQSDFDIADQAGSPFLAELNLQLKALASQSAGTSAPATMYAYQLWADTTNGVIKQRNAANSAWILRATLAETLVVARSSNTVLALADFSRTFIGTSTFSQTLTAAATLTDGWHCFYRNDGSGVITIDPDGSELIDGLATVALQPGESCRIACTGSAFKTVGLTQPRTIVRRKTADESVISSASSQDDDHLTFAIAANEEWVADFYLGAGDSLNTTGIRAAVNAPSGATMEMLIASIGGTKGDAISGHTTTVGAAVNLVTGNFTTGDALIHIHAWILNGATPGNVTLQWAQSTSVATNTTLRKGSNMKAMRVA